MLEQEYAAKLGESFKMITAFSREGTKKVYVQHRLQEHAKEVNELLKAGAYIYVCGDAAHMARDVNSTFGRIISEKRGLSEAQGEEIVKRMRSSNQYQVRDIHHEIYLIQITDQGFPDIQEDVWS